MSFTFKSRAQARQYFTAVNDQTRLAAVDNEYAHLPDRSEPKPTKSAKPNLADVRTQPYRPKP